MLRCKGLENKYPEKHIISSLAKRDYTPLSAFSVEYFHFSLDQFSISARRKRINDSSFMKENADSYYSLLQFCPVKSILKLSAFYVSHFA